MSARKVSSMRCLVRVLFIALVASVAVIEVLVAVKFQEIELLNFGFPWVLNFELPEAVTTFAMSVGAILWLTLVVAIWTETYKKSNYGLTIVEAMVVTFVAAFPVYGIIAGPFVFTLWLNAILWCFAPIVFFRRVGKAEG